MRIDTVTCLPSSHVRVSCTISASRPSRMSAVWRSISWSTARDMALNEFMFFTSTLVPNAARPFGRTDTFTSHRMEPSDRFPSPTPRYRTSRRNFRAVRRHLAPRPQIRLRHDLHQRHARAVIVGERVCAPVIPRRDPFAGKCVSLPASSSMCARVIPIVRVPPPSSTGIATSTRPRSPNGSSN